mmetsp:Transcript_12586/g.39696  ORF Transcript_12586/g.39696 Transcript_12586/m.39696 type:complete len:597 (-) Transcript_12586:144-1934(-)
MPSTCTVKSRTNASTRPARAGSTCRGGSILRGGLPGMQRGSTLDRGRLADQGQSISRPCGPRELSEQKRSDEDGGESPTPHTIHPTPYLPEQQRGDEDGGELLEEEHGLELEEALELALHLGGAALAAPVLGHVVRVQHQLPHRPLRVVHHAVVHDEAAADGEDRPEDRGVPEQVAPVHLRLQERLVDEGHHQQNRGEAPDDEGNELGEHGDDGARELGDVLLRGLYGAGEALVEEVRELVELAQLPLGEGGPAARPDGRGVVVELLRVAQEEVDRHEDGREGGEEDVDRRHPPEALPERALVVEEAVAHCEVVVEHLVEDGPVEVPLEGLGHEHVTVPAREVHPEPEHIHVEHGDEVILFAHDPGHDVVGGELLDQAQAEGALCGHHAVHQLGPRDCLELAVGDPEAHVAEVPYLPGLAEIQHEAQARPQPVHREDDEVQHADGVAQCRPVLQGVLVHGLLEDVARAIADALVGQRAPVDVHEEEAREHDGEAQGHHIEDPRGNDYPEAFLAHVGIQADEEAVEVCRLPRRASALATHEVGGVQLVQTWDLLVLPDLREAVGVQELHSISPARHEGLLPPLEASKEMGARPQEEP